MVKMFNKSIYYINKFDIAEDLEFVTKMRKVELITEII